MLAQDAEAPIAEPDFAGRIRDHDAQRDAHVDVALDALDDVFLAAIRDRGALLATLPPGDVTDHGDAQDDERRDRD
jgi:hypothetical protein